MTTLHPQMPRPGEILVSRLYNSTGTFELEVDVSNDDVTGEGAIVGLSYAAMAGGLVEIFDQITGGLRLFDVRQAVIGEPGKIWEPWAWRPFRDGARIVTSGNVAGLRFFYKLGPVGNLVT